MRAEQSYFLLFALVSRCRCGRHSCQGALPVAPHSGYFFHTPHRTYGEYQHRPILFSYFRPRRCANARAANGQGLILHDMPPCRARPTLTTYSHRPFRHYLPFPDTPAEAFIGQKALIQPSPPHRRCRLQQIGRCAPGFSGRCRRRIDGAMIERAPRLFRCRGCP